MRASLYPWQLLSVILAGILNEHQQHVIEYLKAENGRSETHYAIPKQRAHKRLRQIKVAAGAESGAATTSIEPHRAEGGRSAAAFRDGISQRAASACKAAKTTQSARNRRVRSRVDR